MNKTKLYWTLQLGGWLAFALGQIIVFRTTSQTQISFWLLEAAIFPGVYALVPEFYHSTEVAGLQDG